MKCPHCGQEHSNEATFCPVTGNQIVAFECPNCGQVIMAGLPYCSYCGYNLIAEAQPPPPRRRWWPWLVALGVVVGITLAAVVLWRTLFGQPGPGTSGSSFPTQPPLASQTSDTGSQNPAATGAPTASLPPIETGTPTAAAASATPPDCTAIGQTWVRPKDGMQLLCVPAGSFVIGMKTCPFVGCQKEVNGGSVDLAAYWIDQTEVTNALFTQFVTETAFVTGAEKTGASEVNGNLQAVPGADWMHPQGPDSSISGLADHPVVQINWFAANAYCKWTGSSLPTEAQWEKAARGTDGRLFPWGNDLPKDSLLNAADSSLPVAWARPDQNDGYRYTAPVGSYPAGNSPYGVEDMAGNAWEWTRSLYRDYPYKPADGREIQASPAAGDKVVMRGGGWFDDYGSVRSTLRYGAIPDLSHDATGFRCAYP